MPPASVFLPSERTGPGNDYLPVEGVDRQEAGEVRNPAPDFFDGRLYAQLEARVDLSPLDRPALDASADDLPRMRGEQRL